MEPQKDIEYKNRICNLEKVVKKICSSLKKQSIKKKGYVCQFCGKRVNLPQKGICSASPYDNKAHKYIVEA